MAKSSANQVNSPNVIVTSGRSSTELNESPSEALTSMINTSGLHLGVSHSEPGDQQQKASSGTVTHRIFESLSVTEPLGLGVVPHPSSKRKQAHHAAKPCCINETRTSWEERHMAAHNMTYPDNKLSFRTPVREFS